MDVRKPLLLALIVFSLIEASAQAPVGSGLSAREVVERLWKEATEGELLNADGWKRASRFFMKEGPFRESGELQVVSNDWGIGRVSVSGDTAEVEVELREAGIIDRFLRYSPQQQTSSYKNAQLYHLVSAPTHWTMFKSDGKAITGKEQRIGPTEWQIREAPKTPRTTVNTAIRYVLERRETTTDVALRRHADGTLAKLLKLHCPMPECPGFSVFPASGSIARRQFLPVERSWQEIGMI